MLVFLVLLAVFARFWSSYSRKLRNRSADFPMSLLRVAYNPLATNWSGLDDGGTRAVVGFTNVGRSIVASFGCSTIEVRQGNEWVPWPSELDNRELGTDWAMGFGMVSELGWAWPTNLPAGKPVRLRLWVVREPPFLLHTINYRTKWQIFHRSERLTAYSSEWVTGQ